MPRVVTSATARMAMPVKVLKVDFEVFMSIPF